MKEIALTDIKGIQVGQAENKEAGTGCTVILCREGAVAGADVRGGAPATRETDVLHPLNTVQRIHAVMLSGGSAYGLDCAGGAMQYLEEQDIGFDMGVARVPLVCAASLFDLAVGNAHIRPDKEMGYLACVNSEKKEFLQGNYGAGTGASVGKLLGPEMAMKSGIGAYGLQTGDLQAACVTAVNACGNIVDDRTNTLLAGIYHPKLQRIISCEEALSQMESLRPFHGGNTTIACLVTNARLTKAQCSKIAGMAHNGFARAIRPAHTSSDGDTIFVLSTCEITAPPDAAGILAAEVAARSVCKAATSAESAYGLISHREVFQK